MQIKDISLKAKLAFLLILASGLLVLSGVLSYRQTDALVNDKAWVEHTHKAIRDAGEIVKLMIDLETGQRGFLITGQEEFLEPYEAARQSIFAKIRSTQERVSDNPVQVERLREVERLLREWFETVATPEINARRQVTASGVSSEKLQEVIAGGTGKTILDRIRFELDSLQNVFEKGGNIEAGKVVSTIAKALVDMETGQRGFLLTGKDEFLEPYESGKQLFPQQVAALTEILDRAYDRQAMSRRMAELQQTLQDWLAIAARDAVAMQRRAAQGAALQPDENVAVERQVERGLVARASALVNELARDFAVAGERNNELLTLEIARALGTVESSRRGFLLDARQEYVDTHAQARRRLATHLEQLKTATDNAYDVGAARLVLSRIVSLKADWLRLAGDVEIGLRRKMDQSVQMREVRAMVQTAAGKRIVDQIRGIEREFVAMEVRLLGEREAATARSVDQLKFLAVWGTLGAAVLLLGLGFLVANSVTTSVNRILSALSKVTDGDLEASTGVQSHDELGRVASRFDLLTATMRDVSRVLERVTGGDFSASVEVKSERDVLATSLNTMIDTLRGTQARNESDQWLKSGQTELAESLRGERSLEELGREAITWLSRYLDAQVGLIFIGDEENGFALKGSYAHTHRKENANHFAMGEGLVGQVALEKQTILLGEVPDDYTLIRSGSGKERPRSLIVFPAVYQDKVVAVIELGSVAAFTDEHRIFCETVAESIGAYIHSEVERERGAALLEQTLSQREELKATNEDLESQTQRLKESEEELKAQSEELRVANEELSGKQQELVVKNQQIENARKQVELQAQEVALASKYKSEFLANMSHELRTPLNSLLLLSRALADNKSGNLSDTEVEDARVIYEGGNDLLRLINDIMDFSKVEAGMLDLVIESTNLQAMAEQLRQLFRPVAEDRQLEFEVSVDPTLPSDIATDEQRVQQILKNLLSNALKFTEDGTVRLRIRPPGPSDALRSSSLQYGGCVAFEVSDTGPGIPDSKQAVIFEAFQQADGSTSRNYGGTGLGLSISRELSQLLGGELQVESQVGVGSSFTLFLPLERERDVTTSEPADAASAPAPAPQSTAERLANGNMSQDGIPAFIPDDRDRVQPGDKTLLIIDDDKRFAGILLNHVKAQGYQGLVAGDGRSGVALAQRFVPAGVLLDLGLPDIGGEQVLEQLKYSLRTRHIPVQVISARDKGETGVLGQGAIGYLTKPVSEDDLSAVLKQIESLNSGAGESRILLVEDDELSQRGTAKLLEDGNIVLTPVSTGAEALAKLTTAEYDCVILDLGLPDMSGFEVLRQMHARGQDRSLPAGYCLYRPGA